MIILDSSFIIAYKVEDDVHHNKAIGIIKEIGNGKYGEIVISDYIFDEVITVILNKTGQSSGAINAGEELKKFFDLSKINGELFEDSWEIFKKQEKTRFSFTDCTNLSLMKTNGIKYIATFDEDFRNVKGIEVVGKD